MIDVINIDKFSKNACYLYCIFHILFLIIYYFFYFFALSYRLKSLLQGFSNIFAKAGYCIY